MNNKKNIKVGIFYSLLTVALIMVIFKFGIKAAVGLSEFLQGQKPISESNLYKESVPAPRLYPIVEATNNSEIEIEGVAIPNETVEIYLNDLNVKTFDTNADGIFKGSINLALGINTVYAVTKTHDEQISEPSKTWTVFYEKDPPYLQVHEPQNGTLIKRNASVTIKGEVRAKTSKVMINDHLVIIDENLNFSYPATLNEGENKFKIVCFDPAQNKTELEWVIHFQP
ncbi:hypothetical protein C4578_01670 [Candidatus Microgenomates bacterium]|jgi:hypothetical protein|nr:MAG: hypothetical protein C4578_01670 [Candidatus Microgenomates bacterium]